MAWDTFSTPRRNRHTVRELKLRILQSLPFQDPFAEAQASVNKPFLDPPPSPPISYGRRPVQTQLAYWRS